MTSREYMEKIRFSFKEKQPDWAYICGYLDATNSVVDITNRRDWYKNGMSNPTLNKQYRMGMEDGFGDIDE
jgi:hypothetical protein